MGLVIAQFLHKYRGDEVSCRRVPLGLLAFADKTLDRLRLVPEGSRELYKIYYPPLPLFISQRDYRDTKRRVLVVYGCYSRQMEPIAFRID